MSKKSQGKRKRKGLFDVWKRQYRLRIYGKIPAPLYKSFEKLEHAEEFCSGEIRFQTLENYQSIADKSRNDVKEGCGEITVSGESLLVNLDNKTLTPVAGIENVYVDTFKKSHYIYCLSLPRNGGYSAEIKKFGNYIVKLNCPSLLLRDIAIALQQDSKVNVNPPCLESTRVIYDKLSHYREKPKKSKLNRLRWSQKPAKYKPEREYRIHFHACTVEPISENGIYCIQLKNGVQHCEIIEVKP
ncbi:MAG: hypothetical protein JKY01_00935 [Pseudomonadales bacterium]|nr:hypothetical protein [Pseudomonadales bacterium]